MATKDFAPYAADEIFERRMLSALPWVGEKQAAYCLNLANPIAMVRSELHRVYPQQMAEVDAQRAQQEAQQRAVRSADTETRLRSLEAERAAQRQREADSLDLDRRMGLAPSSGVVRFDGIRQTFGGG